MKANKRLHYASIGYVLFSCLSIITVSAMAFFSPQSVMDLVGTTLPNTDAISSIRGVYGGVGFTLLTCLLYTMRRNVVESLALLSIFWGLYAASRIITIFVDGSLGDFGTRWLVIETVFSLTAVLLWSLARRARSVEPVYS